jgi:peptide/nickel transport system substrate-binding protein
MKGSLQRIAAIVSPTLLLGGVVASTAAAAPIERTATAASSITLAINADPTFNLWSPTAYVESDNIDPLIFDGLTKFGMNGLPAPDLATSWSSSDHGLTWTFQLAHHVTWQDGKPFTSADVVFTYDDIVLNPKLGAEDASNFSDLKDVTADGPYAVEFHLSAPWASLPAYVGYFAPILPEHIFKGVKDPWTLASFDKEHPIGTGPYEVSQVVPGQSITLKRNPTYFGKKPTIETIIYQIVPEETTQIADLISGDLNFIEVDEPQLVPRLQADPTLSVTKVPEQNYYYVALNQRVAPLNNVLVRQALEYAMNRPAMITGLLRGYGEVANGPIAPIQKTYYDPNVDKYPYSVTEALKLLREAGYTRAANGKLEKDGKPLTIDMMAGQYGYLVQASELVANYWQKIGVTVVFKELEWNTFISQVIIKHQFGAAVGWWISPLDPDIWPYYACAAATSGNNFQGTCNSQLDNLLTEGRETASTSARVKIYDKVQVLLAQQQDLNYLWYPLVVDATSANLYLPSVNINIALDNVDLWRLKG